MTTPRAPGKATARPGWLRRNVRWIVFAVALAGGGGVFVSRKLKPIDVTASPVVRGRAIDAVYATGTVEAEDRVNVKAKTNGSLAEVLVKEGDPVKKGDLLARIDNPFVTFDLLQGKAALNAASAQASKNAPQIEALKGQAKAMAAELEQARLELSRAEMLVKQSAVAQSEVDRAAARVRQIEGQVSANEAQQRAARIDLDANAARTAAQVQSLTSRVTDTEVRAPLDGVVLTKTAEVGEVIVPNQTLFKVGDTRSLILEVSVDEADVSRVQDGRAPQGRARAASVAAVSLYAFPKQVFRGQVFEVFPDANRDRKAFLAKVRLDAPPEGMRSGMSAEVNIIAGEKEGALLIPSEAEASGSIWLVQGGRATKRKVTIGIRDLLRLEVLEGVAEGDLVVVEGQDKIEEGKKVSVTIRPQDKFAPLPDANQPTQTTVK